MVILSNRIRAELPSLPPAAKRDGTAGRILSAALVLFARRGYTGTSIRDIGDELDLTGSTLYTHFQSKAHLLETLVRLGYEEHRHCLRKALAESPPDPIAQLGSLVRAHVKVHAEYAMLLVVANHEAHLLSPELVVPSLALLHGSQAMFLDVIRRGVEQGVFRAPHEWVTMAAVWAVGMHVATWYRPDFELTPEQIADAHVDLATRMLTRAPESIAVKEMASGDRIVREDAA